MKQSLYHYKIFLLSLVIHVVLKLNLSCIKVFFFFLMLIHLFLAVLGLHYCTRAFSAGSSPLHSGFLQPWCVRSTFHCGAWTSRCGGLSCSTGPRCMGFSRCSTQAWQLWLLGLAAPQHMESSQTRDRTHVPRIDRRTCTHCATRAVCVSC